MLPRIGFLFLLYLIQGLPFGFQARALPAHLREAGVSLTAITLMGMLSLPWALKALWAPWVDRAHRGRLGHRRAWILPLQLALAATCAVAARVEPEGSLVPLLALVLLMNLFTAFMDIAVDGLAVDTLRREHLGYGNIAQVVGFKVGMLLSGGLLLAWSGTIGWSGMFAIMTALILAGATVTLLFREDPVAAPGSEPPATVRQVVAHLVAALRVPAARWVLLVIATYKLGETMADVLFVPFLTDAGFAPERIGLWLGTYGMVASIAGSVAGGVVASRTRLVTAVAVLAILRVLPVAGELWLTLTTPTPQAVIAVTVAESFFGGALTTAMFAFMMAQVDRRIGATHFTLFATVEVLGKSVSGWLSGALADATSYPVVYGAATLLSLAFLVLLVPLARRAPGPS